MLDQLGGAEGPVAAHHRGRAAAEDHRGAVAEARGDECVLARKRKLAALAQVHVRRVVGERRTQVGALDEVDGDPQRQRVVMAAVHALNGAVGAQRDCHGRTLRLRQCT